MILRKLTDRVDLVNAEVVEGHGGQSTRDWAHADVATGRPALMQFLGADEDTDSRDTSTARWRLFLGPQEPVTAYTRVRWSGMPAVDLEVDGQPGLVPRRGRPDHYEITLQVAVEQPLVDQP